MTTPRQAPDFLFENVGSHGDIMPLLAIAAELVRRGHRCQLLANEHFRAEAAARGVGFFPIARERTHGEIHGSGELEGKGVVSYFYLKCDRIREYFQQPNASHERTVMVHSNAFGGSEPVAEAYRLRTVQLILFPVRIQSAIAPAWPIGARACGPGREEFLKRLPAMYRAADRHPSVLAKINAVRASLGLAPVNTAKYERPHLVAQAAMFPEWYGMPAADWPKLDFLGFPLPHSDLPMPGAVQEFLARCQRPVVFTTGTGMGTPERFFEAAAACCAELDRPGIFLSPFLAADRPRLGKRIAGFTHVELEQLLPHVAAIVHHGGMGTTARGLQAGVPQVTSPIGFDQPDNGHRLEVLGVGRVVPRERLSGATLSAALGALLSDAAIASKLSHYRAALQNASAVERAADLLEKVARGTALAA